jgi:hypothetical protein
MLLVCRRRRLQQRKWWKREGMFTVMHHKLRKYSDKLFEFYRMSEGSFDYLLYVVSGSLKNKNSSMRESVGVEEKLSVTLR